MQTHLRMSFAVQHAALVFAIVSFSANTAKAQVNVETAPTVPMPGYANTVPMPGHANTTPMPGYANTTPMPGYAQTSFPNRYGSGSSNYNQQYSNGRGTAAPRSNTTPQFWQQTYDQGNYNPYAVPGW